MRAKQKWHELIMCYYGQYFMYGNDLFVFPFFKKTHFQKIVCRDTPFLDTPHSCLLAKRTKKLETIVTRDRL